MKFDIRMRMISHSKNCIIDLFIYDYYLPQKKKITYRRSVSSNKTQSEREITKKNASFSFKCPKYWYLQTDIECQCHD